MAQIVAEGNIRKAFSCVAPRARLSRVMCRQLRLSTEPHAPCHCPRSPFAGACQDQRSFELARGRAAWLCRPNDLSGPRGKNLQSIGAEVPRKFLWEFEGPCLWGGLPVIVKDENCRQAQGRNFPSHKFNEIIAATNSASVKSQVF
jgi:hypothetical protein